MSITIPSSFFQLDELLKSCKEYDYSKDGISKKIISYDKSKMSSNNNELIKLMRSVVLINGNLVCFSPPKSSISEDTVTNVEEFIEGTMINAYFNKVENVWEIATKRMIGGDNQFYKPGKTFKELFEDTCNYIGFKLERLNPEYCYSFVMQHPYNQYVGLVYVPKLYIIEIYKITKRTELSTPQLTHYFDIEVIDKTKECLSNAIIPQQININSIKELSNFNTNFNNRENLFVGYSLKYGCHRGKILHPMYKYYKELKGNYSSDIYRFLNLEENGRQKLDEFLYYFPEYLNLYNYYESSLQHFVLTLFDYYKYVNVAKQLPLKECDRLYKRHIYTLHGLYLNKHVSRITQELVMNYVNDLDIKSKAFIIEELYNRATQQS